MSKRGMLEGLFIDCLSRDGRKLFAGL